MSEEKSCKEQNLIDKTIKNTRVENTELVIEDDTIYEIDLECCHCKKYHKNDK